MLRFGSLRLHWSLALGALLFCAPRFAPVLLGAYALVLLAHAAGHAVAIWSCGLRIAGLTLHGLGGELGLEGQASPLARSAIAWAGAAAQGALLLAALWLQDALGRDLAFALTRLNAVVLGLNLIPVAPLDGAEAWRIFARLGRKSKRPRFPDPLRVQRDVAKLLASIRKKSKAR